MIKNHRLYDDEPEIDPIDPIEEEIEDTNPPEEKERPKKPC